MHIQWHRRGSVGTQLRRLNLTTWARIGSYIYMDSITKNSNLCTAEGSHMLIRMYSHPT